MSKAPGKKTGPPGAAGQPVKGQPNWLLILLWGITFFLLLQMLNKKSEAPQHPHTLPENLALLQQQCHDLQEATALKTLDEIKTQINEVEGNLDNSVKQKKLEPVDAANQKQTLETELFDSTMLTSDVELRAGELHAKQSDGSDYKRFDTAYNTLLVPAESKWGQTQFWSRLVTVTDEHNLSQEVTGVQLYTRAVADLSAANKTSLVMGFLPGYQLIDWLVHLTGANPGFSYWFAPLLLAVLVRAAIWPLTQKQLMFGRQASQLTPMLNEIKVKYKADQQMSQKKTMELYAEYGINPFASCGPLFVQMPVFWVVYGCMLKYKFEFQKGTFLWITQHSHAVHPFFAPNLGMKDTLLILIYGVTLLVSTLLTPVSDPTQVRQQRTMGISMSLIFPIMMLTGAYQVPSAFVLYWTFTNVVATIQSLRAYYLLPKPPLVKVNTATGGVIPTKTKTSFMDRMREKYEEEMRRKEELTGDKDKKDDDPPGGAPAPKPKPTSPPKAPGSGKQTPKRRK